ncbi:flagellar export protein FliJ [Helicobacter mesocricetorum]|uniref:flagellar export protein FliJ n=1 Tax=Helicobacter mesocricetorum TaxID=87012 RepID=UPI000CF0FF06|nr:flagellar export protein FliJ [Helicobacter mesocricetorum]
MKTKFTPLVLLQQQKIDVIEQELQRNTQAIKIKQEEIDMLIAEFATLKEPTSGVYQAFLTFVHHKNEYRQSIDYKMGELALLKKKKQELQESFRVQNVELEKAKYLDSLEVKKVLQKLKKRENVEMDEISVMLYANNKEIL